jgi:hypothetical protein
MTDKTIYDEPSDVDAENGTVVVNGPDAVDVRLTPEAAEETSERLSTGAMKARGQLLLLRSREMKKGRRSGPLDSEGDETKAVRVEGGVSGPRPITFRCLQDGP